MVGLLGQLAQGMVLEVWTAALWWPVTEYGLTTGPDDSQVIGFCRQTLLQFQPPCTTLRLLTPNRTLLSRNERHSAQARKNLIPCRSTFSVKSRNGTSDPAPSVDLESASHNRRVRAPYYFYCARLKVEISEL